MHRSWALRRLEGGENSGEDEQEMTGREQESSAPGDEHATNTILRNREMALWQLEHGERGTLRKFAKQDRDRGILYALHPNWGAPLMSEDLEWVAGILTPQSNRPDTHGAQAGDAVMYRVGRIPRRQLLLTGKIEDTVESHEVNQRLRDEVTAVSGHGRFARLRRTRDHKDPSQPSSAMMI